MRFKPEIWRPIAIVATGLNLAGIVWAAGEAEPGHAAIHAVLALFFGWWAQRLKAAPQAEPDSGRLEAIESELQELRREVYELQERLDFTERMLTQAAESRRGVEER